MPSSSHVLRRYLGDAATAVLLLPGAVVGALVRAVLWATNTPPSPMLAVMLGKGKEEASRDKEEASTADAQEQGTPGTGSLREGEAQVQTA